MKWIRAIRTRTVDLLGKTDQTEFIIEMIRTVSKTQHAFCCIGLFH